MSNKMPCVYALFCKATGLPYIGSTVDLSTRLPTHLKRLREGWHHSRKLQRAWNKYGEYSFCLSVLEFCPEGQLQEREQFHMDAWEAYRCGYNCTPIAGSTRGYVQSEETRAKKSLAMKGRKQSPLHVQRRSQSMMGKNTGNVAWCRGKTKETDSRLAAAGLKVSLKLKGRTAEEIFGAERAKWKRENQRLVLTGRKRVYAPDGSWKLEPRKESQPPLI